jgi:hypothetical protein
MEEENKRLQETDFDHYREAGTTIACFGNAREEGILAQAKNLLEHVRYRPFHWKKVAFHPRRIDTEPT